MTDPEVVGNGEERLLPFGSDWEEFEETMEFYFPDEEVRKDRYQNIVKRLIEEHRLVGLKLQLFPSEGSTLDLRDDSLNELLTLSQQEKNSDTKSNKKEEEE